MGGIIRKNTYLQVYTTEFDRKTVYKCKKRGELHRWISCCYIDIWNVKKSVGHGNGQWGGGLCTSAPLQLYNYYKSESSDKSLHFKNYSKTRSTISL